MSAGSIILSDEGMSQIGHVPSITQWAAQKVKQRVFSGSSLLLNPRPLKEELDKVGEYPGEESCHLSEPAQDKIAQDAKAAPKETSQDIKPASKQTRCDLLERLTNVLDASARPLISPPQRQEQLHDLQSLILRKRPKINSWLEDIQEGQDPNEDCKSHFNRLAKLGEIYDPKTTEHRSLSERVGIPEPIKVYTEHGNYNIDPLFLMLYNQVQKPLGAPDDYKTQPLEVDYATRGDKPLPECLEYSSSSASISQKSASHEEPHPLEKTFSYPSASVSQKSASCKADASIKDNPFETLPKSLASESLAKYEELQQTHKSLACTTSKPMPESSTTQQMLERSHNRDVINKPGELGNDPSTKDDVSYILMEARGQLREIGNPDSDDESEVFDENSIATIRPIPYPLFIQPTLNPLRKVSITHPVSIKPVNVQSTINVVSIQPIIKPVADHLTTKPVDIQPTIKPVDANIKLFDMQANIEPADKGLSNSSSLSLRKAWNWIHGLCRCFLSCMSNGDSRQPS
ncbi:MAG: hypothetical protein LQ340_006749 [Diploschistes diacapsis]|nr:MAG: hypothetical protein LQ340_006749 [Diploschistes diacapsis]